MLIWRYSREWLTWMKNNFGLPARVEHRSAVKGAHSISTGYMLSLEYSKPDSPCDMATTTRQSASRWSSAAALMKGLINSTRPVITATDCLPKQLIRGTILGKLSSPFPPSATENRVILNRVLFTNFSLQWIRSISYRIARWYCVVCRISWNRTGIWLSKKMKKKYWKFHTKLCKTHL